MKFSIGRLIAATGIILLSTLAAMMVAAPVLTKFKLPDKTPVESLVVVVIAAAWIVALVLINGKRRWVLLAAVAATVFALVFWADVVQKAFKDAQAWMSKVDLTIFVGPQLVSIALISMGAAALCWFIFGDSSRR